MALGTELDDAEQQYFKNGGEGEIPADTPSEAVPAPVETPAAEVVPEVKAEPAKPAETPQEPAKDTPEEIQRKLNAALSEARANNRQLRESKAQADVRYEEQARQLQVLLARLNPEQQKPPAFEENPAEHLKAEVEMLKQARTQTEQQQADSAKAAQFSNWYKAQAQTYAQTQPDFFAAYGAYNKARSEELQNAGLTPAAAAERLIAEEVQLASAAGQSGINPAQLVYQAALLKGYTPVSRQTHNPQAGASNLIQNVKAGMAASTPLSSVGGGGQTENLSWEWVASVPDDEFLAAFAKMEKADAKLARH